MTSFRKPFLVLAAAGGLLAVQACGVSDTRGTAARSDTSEPAQLGLYRNSDTGKVYEMYDLDGDGMPDVAKEKGTNKWSQIVGITLTPVDPEDIPHLKP